MKISVVIPVYKSEKYLEKCVDSVLKQIFVDFEVLLINDGSPDRCGEICDALCRVDKRVRVIHQENKGVTCARAAGVKQSRGEWICFVDSDDILPPDALFLMSSGICDEADIVIAFLNIHKVIKRRWMDLGTYRRACITGKKVYPGPCGRLFRRTLFDDTTFDIPRSIVKGEDMLMNIRLAFTTQKDIRIIPHKVYTYVPHDESCVHTFTPTCDYEHLFSQERLRSIPADQQYLYETDIIKNRLKALHRVVSKNAEDVSWQDSLFVKQLKEDIIRTKYSLSFKDRILLNLENDFVVKLWTCLKRMFKLWI